MSTDYMFTHTHISDNAFGKRTEYMKVVGTTDPATIRRMGYEFRVLDGDGIVYFEGRSMDDSSFRPLDATSSSYGTTEIQYRNTESGKWETL